MMNVDEYKNKDEYMNIDESCTAVMCLYISICVLTLQTKNVSLIY